VIFRFFRESRRLSKIFVYLRQELPAVPGVQAASVYGPWAARARRGRGVTPGEPVDLVVVGGVDETELARFCRQASDDLAIEVKATVVSGEDWRTDATDLVRAIKAGPLLTIV
jgi:hypothetical protein